jgi:hypothetical protein
VLRQYLNVLLLWFSSTVGEGRLWERLRIYSGKLFIIMITSVDTELYCPKGKFGCQYFILLI